MSDETAMIKTWYMYIYTDDTLHLQMFSNVKFYFKFYLFAFLLNYIFFSIYRAA